MGADWPRFEEIRPRTRALGHVLVHLRSTDSTMTEARRAAAHGEEPGYTVVADQQTGGMGRRGRVWFSPRGNLHATVLLRPKAAHDQVSWIPLLAGLAMAEAIERVAGVDARLKWPNDVLVGGKKVAGVLTEARWDERGRLEWVLVGVGVNGNVTPADLPVEVRASATTLRAAFGRTVCLPALLKVFLERLEARLDDAARPKEALRGIVERRLATLGRRVRVATPEATIEGTALRLGDRGELVLETSEGERSVDAGDCEHLRLV